MSVSNFGLWIHVHISISTISFMSITKMDKKLAKLLHGRYLNVSLHRNQLNRQLLYFACVSGLHVKHSPLSWTSDRSGKKGQEARVYWCPWPWPGHTTLQDNVAPPRTSLLAPRRRNAYPWRIINPGMKGYCQKLIIYVVKQH